MPSVCLIVYPLKGFILISILVLYFNFRQKWSLMMIQCPKHTILVPFWQYLRCLNIILIGCCSISNDLSCSFDKLAITLQPFPFFILIEKYRALQLLWCEKSQSSGRYLHVFSLPKFDLFLFYLMERRASATYNTSQANWVIFVWLFDKC